MKRVVLLALILSMTLPFSLPGIVSADFDVRNFRLSAEANGPAATALPQGATVVYVNFDYVDAAGVPIQLKLYDPTGQVLYLQTFEYQGSGSESIEISNGGFPFSDGAYVLNMYTGKLSRQTGGTELFIYESIEWTVGDATIPAAGTGEVIATVVVQGAPTAPSAATSRASIAALILLLVVLIVVVGWAVRGLVTSRA